MTRTDADRTDRIYNAAREDGRRVGSKGLGFKRSGKVNSRALTAMAQRFVEGFRSLDADTGDGAMSEWQEGFWSGVDSRQEENDFADGNLRR